MFHCHAFNIEPDRGSENSFLSLSCGIIFDAKHPKSFLSIKLGEVGVIEVAESEVKKKFKV